MTANDNRPPPMAPQTPSQLDDAELDEIAVGVVTFINKFSALMVQSSPNQMVIKNIVDDRNTSSGKIANSTIP